jgi:hypothetical protein
MPIDVTSNFENGHALRTRSRSADSMDQTTTATPDLPVLAFEDGLGRRYRVKTDGDHQLEILCLRSQLTEIPSFEFSLRERVNRLAGFQHPCYAKVSKVDRLKDGRGTLALFSEFAPGVRLAELVAESERRGLALDASAALSIVQQVAAAAAGLQQDAHMANGALGPERVIITPHGRPIILEFVLSAALEQLRYSRERYWRDLRVALPTSGGLPCFDQCADAAQLGMLALALLAGRLILADEFPDGLEGLVSSACAGHAHTGLASLMPQLRSWLGRALQLDAHNSFKSAFEAKTELDSLLSGEDTAHALTNFLGRYHGSATPVASRPWASQPGIRTFTGNPEPPEPPAPIQIQPAPPSEPAHAEIENESVADRGEEEPDEEEPDEEELIDEIDAERPRFRGRAWLAASLVLTAMAGVLFAGERYFSPSAVRIGTGTLAVNTNPPGAQVIVDNQLRGQTPLSLSLAPGPHNLVVRGDGEPRMIPVTIVAGQTSAEHVELPRAAATAGLLQVWSEPSGARVAIDGKPRGTTPLTATDLTSGQHDVVLQNELRTVNHTVMVVPGVPASLIVPMGAPQGTPVSGWISVSAPVEMELYEQGRLLGSTSVDRLMLSTGKHDIEIVSEPLDYRVTRSVQVAPGRVSPIAVTLPTGVVSLNAIPWANVSIDGQSAGETPIGNLSVSIGPHEVAFLNPQFGEQRRVIMVTLREPVRLSVDLTKK